MRATAARAVVVLIAVVCVGRGDPAGTSTATAVRLEADGLGIVSFGAAATATTRALTQALGAATSHPTADCGGAYRETAWHDLIVQFVSGRFTGYRYLISSDFSRGVPPTTTALISARPRLSTPSGVTLGSTLVQAKRAYPALRQSGTDFWRTTSVNDVGVTFAIFNPSGHTAPTAQIYEIKDNVCPGSL